MLTRSSFEVQRDEPVTVVAPVTGRMEWGPMLPTTGLADNALIIGGVLLLVAAGALVVMFRKK